MKVIWKYELDTGGMDMISCEIEAPRDFEPLSVQLQYGIPTLWAVVDPRSPLCRHLIDVVGTGWNVDPKEKYIGTILLCDDTIVQHIYYGGPVEIQDQ